MFVWRPLLALVIVVVFCPAVEGKKKKPKLDKDTKCAVCESLIDELQYYLDNKLSMDIDLRGRLEGRTRKGKYIPYRQSELAAVEAMEHVCSSMKDYGLSNEGKHKTLARFNARSGEDSVSVSNVQIDSKLAESFEAYCDEIIGENDAVVTESITRGDDLAKMEESICYAEGMTCAALKRKPRHIRSPPAKSAEL
mmetsp:Transcript_73001/g.171612  ORF Transcript_73001/g.171612 Transcript_73001/m.171612 type:complete len:195 (-) Transcript_73001:47-631(-)|eukprot:CAMPEP_0175847276 /NCGR_PEP_ID=MMETSP0107_2-20121207/23263_1 /TAXON_ID=195067 ORGANISM="Goniomonas pacifica, Strain CCMP1869" /NCGR_SAMPLE_ID=MMETSP0107_2 /ASSEMBLY_ACC=CAM_ASM_000203 /LENGTH=194 /DNA_ID=CAMNT_0017162073 /DNA_START=6 /DNA_END=590 /DNA_ORIENTATION=-